MWRYPKKSLRREFFPLPNCNPSSLEVKILTDKRNVKVLKIIFGPKEVKKTVEGVEDTKFVLNVEKKDTYNNALKSIFLFYPDLSG